MIAITIDLDWVPDEIIQFTFDLLDTYHVRATVFCTHKVAVGIHEPALHPNFEHGESPQEATLELLQLFPQARGVRSHVLTISTRIFEVYAQLGLTYDSSYYMFNQTIWPFPTVGNVLEMPIFFEDDLYFRAEGEKDFCLESLNLAAPGLKIFDFHPVHVFLNTHSMSHYLDAKPDYHNPGQLARKIGKARGTRDLFIELLEYVQENQERTYSLSEIEDLARSGRLTRILDGGAG